MGDGTHRSEPCEVHVNPDYITQAWRYGDCGTVYMQGHEDPLRLDAKSFAKVVKWLSGNDAYMENDQKHWGAFEVVDIAAAPQVEPEDAEIGEA